jgi:hypothetical protein
LVVATLDSAGVPARELADTAYRTYRGMGVACPRGADHHQFATEILPACSRQGRRA